MKNNLIFLCLFICSFASCKKENQKTCWFLAQGGAVVSGEICNKTQREMEEQYGNQYFFFRASERRFCWRLKNANNANYNYARNLPQSVIDKFYTPYGYESIKIACNSFCIWEIFIKSRSKITGYYQPTRRMVETFSGSAADTCSKLFLGKEVILRETTDSLITVIYNQEF